MPNFDSFIKACLSYFGDERTVTIPEFKALTTQDKIELSKMLNEAGFTHKQYEPPKTEVEVS